MRKPKLKWTPEETKALIEGVNKYGVSHWKIILDDPQFSHILRFRSNTDLRIKWRNMNLTTQKQIEGLSTDEEIALGALGELKYGVDNWKSNQEDPEFNKCSDSGSDVEHQNMNVEASMPQPAIQIQDQLNVESNQIAECKRRPPKRKMSEMQSEFDANAQAETDAEEESEAKAEAETEAEAKTEAARQQGLLNHWKKQKKE